VVLLVTLIAVIAAYQVDTAHVVDVGGYYDRVYVQDFHEREEAPDGETYRWSTDDILVRFPQVGTRGRWLSLRLHGYRPPNLSSPQVRVFVNGTFLATLATGPQWGEYLLWVPAQVGRATTEIGLEVDTFVPSEAGTANDPRRLGVSISEVSLLPLAGEGFSWGWPPLATLSLSLFIAGGLYLGLILVGLSRWWSAGVAGLASIALAYFLAFHRLWVTIYTHRLAIAVWLGVLFLPVLHWLFERVFDWGRVPFGKREMRLLLAIFLVGFWIKAAGLLYPHSVAWDLLWHLEKSQRVTEGRLAEIYRPGAFSESVMPAEWGEEKPMIPYSPYYHLTAVSFFYLPWRPYDTANVLSVLLDTTKPFLIYFLARRLGLGRRVGLWAGLLYAAIPATFLLHAWGNVPTTTGLWWTLASICYIVGSWERLRQPRTWAGLTFFLLGTMLYYTVTATFMGIFLGILLLGLWLENWLQKRRSREKAGKYPLGAILLSLVVAVGLATAIYYGQYIRPVIEVTIPHFLGGGPGGTEVVSWSEYLDKHLIRLATLRYGLIWPMLLALAGLLLGRRHLRRPFLRWILIAWFGTASVFMVAGRWVDMVDKQHWFAMPALALCAGITIDWLWQRSQTGRVLATTLYLFLAAASIQTWLFRLITKKQIWFLHDARIIGEGIAPLIRTAWQALFRG
jgi:hypothetical protein